MPKKSSSIPNFSVNWKPLRKSLETSDSYKRKSSAPAPIGTASSLGSVSSGPDALQRDAVCRSTAIQRRAFNADLDMSTDAYQTICNGYIGNISQFKSLMSSSKSSNDWLSLEKVILDVFNETGQVMLGAGTLAAVHENVRNLLDSNIGSFVYDRYQSQMLKKGMAVIRDRVLNGYDLITCLCDNWQQFYSNILPALDCILFRVKAKCGLTVRQTTLVAFRDEVILKTSFEEELNRMVNQDRDVSPDIRHMLLVLQSVYECYPPSKNKIHIEALTALVVSPYQGYKGLYLNHKNTEPEVVSREPVLNAKRKSIDMMCRAVGVGSRPLTMQPKQLETLNELFASALRKNT